MMRGDMRGYRRLGGQRLPHHAAGCAGPQPPHGRPASMAAKASCAAPPISGLLHFARQRASWRRSSRWCRGEWRRCGGLRRHQPGGADRPGRWRNAWATWPAAARPDALMLITTTDRVSALTFNSSLRCHHRPRPGRRSLPAGRRRRSAILPGSPTAAKARAPDRPRPDRAADRHAGRRRRPCDGGRRMAGKLADSGGKPVRAAEQGHFRRR